jgi:hypothetical protein
MLTPLPRFGLHEATPSNDQSKEPLKHLGRLFAFGCGYWTIAMLLGLTASGKNLELVQNLVQNCVRFVIGDTVEGSTIPAG